MTTNNNGHLVDEAGNVVVDFVWGNFPLQPNDARPDTATGRLNYALDNHVIAETGWNGYPLYTPNTDGSAVDGNSDGVISDNEIFLTVPAVIGLTTALAVDALKDAGFATVTTAAAATNAAKTVTAASRTSGSHLCSLTVSSHGFSAGQLVVVTGVDSAVNGTWVVDPSTTSGTLVVGTTPTTAKSLTGLTGSVVGLEATIKTVAYGSGNASNQTTASTVTVTPFAAAS